MLNLKRLVPAAALLSTLVGTMGFAQNSERKLYVGVNSHEATLTFNGQVEIVSIAPPSEQTARNAIQRQITHMFGPLTHGYNDQRAVPKTDNTISDIKIAAVGGKYVASYQYKGTVVVEDGAETIDVPLPLEPASIWQTSSNLSRTSGGACADYSANQYSFWYYWNPKGHGCQLKEGKDYAVFKGSLAKKENTKATFPEYKRLVNAKNEVTIGVLMGTVEHHATDFNPNTTWDQNARNYLTLRDYLTSVGYVSSGQWTNEQIAKVAPGATTKEAYVETLTKEVNGVKVIVRMFFGATGIDEHAGPFHHFYADSVKNDSVMIYAGHAGLGRNLALGGIEQTSGVKIEIDPSKYQLFFFNACSSYPYYAKMYFDKKGGTKNLDIITNGLLTYVSVIDSSSLAVLQSVDAYVSKGTKVSYQAMAKSMDSDNLLGVNGDEDNE